MSKVSPKATNDEKQDVKVAVMSSRRKATQSAQKKPLFSFCKICNVVFHFKHNVAYPRDRISLVFHATFFVLSTALLFAYLLREYFALEFRTKWELNFILVSVFCYTPVGMLLFLAEATLPRYSLNRLHSLLSFVFQLLWVLGTNVCMGYALYMMIHTEQCMLSDPRDVHCDYKSIHKIPEALMLTMLATPQVLSLFVSSLRPDVLFLSWLSNAAIILACIIQFNASNSLVPFLVSVPVSFYALHVSQRQKEQLFSANLRLAAYSTK
jgi:hypothetical protein